MFREMFCSVIDLFQIIMKMRKKRIKKKKRKEKKRKNELINSIMSIEMNDSNCSQF